MIFQLAEDYYKVPNLYNNLLEHLVTRARSAARQTIRFSVHLRTQCAATAPHNPDYHYVEPARRDQHVRPGQGRLLPAPRCRGATGPRDTAQSARTIAVPATHVAWGITLMNGRPNKENAIKFLQLLLSPAGTALLNENGPAPISPALVSAGDFHKLPDSLKPLVKVTGK